MKCNETVNLLPSSLGLQHASYLASESLASERWIFSSQDSIDVDSLTFSFFDSCDQLTSPRASLTFIKEDYHSSASEDECFPSLKLDDEDKSIWIITSQDDILDDVMTSAEYDMCVTRATAYLEPPFHCGRGPSITRFVPFNFPWFPRTQHRDCLISVLQFLYRLPDFSERLVQLKPLLERNSEFSLLKALVSLDCHWLLLKDPTVGTNNSNMSKILHEVSSALQKELHIDLGKIVNQDTVHLFTKIVSYMDEIILNNPLAFKVQPLEPKFRIEFIRRAGCYKCSNVTEENVWSTMMLRWDVLCAQTLDMVLVDKFYSADILHDCEKCGSEDGFLQRAINLMPAYLLVHVNRFRYNGKRRKEIVEVSQQLTFDHRLQPISLVDYHNADQRSGPSYKLLGCITHSGDSFESGVYACMAYDAAAGHWFRCNARELEEVHMDSVIEEAETYGYMLLYKKQ